MPATDGLRAYAAGRGTAIAGASTSARTAETIAPRTLLERYGIGRGAPLRGISRTAS